MRHDPHVATESSIGPRFRGGLAGASWTTLGMISAGGVIGALARYGLLTAFPHAPAGFAWGTFAINVSGALLIGVVIVVATETRRVHHLVRPFLATGVLLGFLVALTSDTGVMAFAGTGFCGALTTYSTFSYETVRLAQGGARTLAALNVGASILAGLGAAYCGMSFAHAL